MLVRRHLEGQPGRRAEPRRLAPRAVGRRRKRRESASGRRSPETRCRTVCGPPAPRARPSAPPPSRQPLPLESSWPAANRPSQIPIGSARIRRTCHRRWPLPAPDYPSAHPTGRGRRRPRRNPRPAPGVRSLQPTPDPAGDWPLPARCPAAPPQQFQRPPTKPRTRTQRRRVSLALSCCRSLRFSGK